MSKTVTVRDIAYRANVSNGTVSRVLNGHVNVADDLRRRVIEAVKELGYTPSRRQHAAEVLSLRSIGFLLTLPHLEPAQDFMAPFWAHLLQGAETQAARIGAQVTYCSLPGRNVTPADILQRIADLRLDATLLVGAPSPAVVEAVQELRIPVVVLDSILDPDDSDGKPQDAVLPDYFRGTYLVTRELISAGHRHVAFIGGPMCPDLVRNAVPAIEMRARGFREALIHAGLAPRPELIAASDLTQQGGYETTRDLLAMHPCITSLVCANDALASGAIRALRDQGRRVPEEISVVGGSDELGEHTFPRLTSYRFDQSALGSLAVQRLARRAKNPGAQAVTTILPVEIVGRQSVLPPPEPKEAEVMTATSTPAL